MSLALYCDENVNMPVVRGLRRRGVDCIHVSEDGRRTAPDEIIFQRAQSLGRVLVTGDEDFFSLADTVRSAGQDSCGIAFIDQDAPIGALVDDLELLAKVYEPADMENRVEYLPYA